MTRTFYPGAWYSDALPDGEQCILIPGSHIETHLGRVSIPPETGLGTIFLRCTNVEGFRFAGPSHQQTTPTYTRTWEYDNGEWTVAREISYICNSPVIYDNDGALLIADPSVGSNGYRYVDSNGVVWTGDQTYGPWNSLSEWSDIGDGLYVGQSHPDWARDAAWIYDSYTGLHHALEPGRCTFIRAHAAGDRFALTLVKPEDAGTVIYRGTFAELRALPVVDPAGPPVPPEPGPGPDPGPEPPEPPEPGPEPPEPTPDPYLAIPMRDTMTPFATALRLGAHFCARVDPTPGLAPWPGWFLVRFDGTDPHDSACRWEVTKPDANNPKLRARHVETGATMTMDFTEYGGNVCQGFYGSPESAGWFGYQQLAGWQLGPGGVEVLTVDYTPAGTKAAAPCLTVVRL